MIKIQNSTEKLQVCTMYGKNKHQKFQMIRLKGWRRCSGSKTRRNSFGRKRRFHEEGIDSITTVASISIRRLNVHSANHT
ncbi:hypothetical protein Hdeb2414_s0016g00482241 [Helianthus debilis subsp. tardiflorus]